MIAVVTILTNRMQRNLFLPIPNYLDAERQSDIDVTDASHIVRVWHHVGFGRLAGRTIPCPQFTLRLGLTFGARIEGFDSPSPDDRVIRICNRKHLQVSEIIPDYLRHVKHWDSLTPLLARVSIRLHGLGFPYGCSMREMILTVTEIYRLSRRIQCLSSSLTHLPIRRADLAMPETDSLSPWLDYPDSEEQN